MYICVYVELLSLSPSAAAVISNVIAIVFAGPGPNGQQLGFYCCSFLHSLAADKLKGSTFLCMPSAFVRH